MTVTAPRSIYAEHIQGLYPTVYRDYEGILCMESLWEHDLVELGCSVIDEDCVWLITAVSVDELRQAASACCSQLDDDSQRDDASSHCPCELDSDSSDLSLPQHKVTSDHWYHWWIVEV